MPLTAEDFQRIHRLHQQVTDLRGHLERGPRRVTATEVELSGTELKHSELKEQSLRTRMAADEQQLESDERKAKIAELKKKLNVCSTNKEYQSFTEEIAANDQTNNELDDDIFASLEELDLLEIQLAELDQQQNTISADLERVRQSVETEQKRLNAELDRVSVELKQAESQMPEDLKQNYERMAEVRGEGALAPVDNECCGGCFQRITTQMISNLRMAKPVFCQSCGCLLYLPKEASITNEHES